MSKNLKTKEYVLPIFMIIFGIIMLLSMFSPLCHDYYWEDTENAYNMLDFSSDYAYTKEFGFAMIFLVPMSYAMLLCGIGYVVMGILTIVKPELKSKCIRYGSTMSIIALIAAIVYFLVGLITMLVGDFDLTLGFIPLFLVTTCFILYNSFKNNGDVGSTFSDEDDNYIYRKLSIHICLLLFTCGIWNFIWIYRVTKYLNCVKDEQKRNPATEVILCMFIPFYTIFWTYKNAQRIDVLAKKYHVASDMSTMCLILAIFVSFVPPILMQDKINGIILSKSKIGQENYEDPTETENVASKSNISSISEDLKKYKELLDMGIITQEEFDSKKKELLGI